MDIFGATLKQTGTAPLTGIRRLRQFSLHMLFGVMTAASSSTHQFHELQITENST